MNRLGLTVAISMACIVVAAMGMVATIGFACLSLYFYLSSIASPALAALGVAIAALIFTGAVTALVGLIPRPKLFSFFAHNDDVLGRAAEALSLGKHLGDEGRDFLKSNLSRASAFAFGLGILMGISPKLRKAIMDILLG